MFYHHANIQRTYKVVLFFTAEKECELALCICVKAQSPDTPDAFRQRARFFDFHRPITLILVSVFYIFRHIITFWVTWSTYLLKFSFIGCFINFQKLKTRAALLNRVRCVWTWLYEGIKFWDRELSTYLHLRKKKLWKIANPVKEI
jgi:hypothetical protein